MPAPRHLDLDAVMLWRTLGQIGPASTERLVEHWRPTYSLDQVRRAMERLQANRCVQCDRSHQWHDTADLHMRAVLLGGLQPIREAA